eukprot:Skav205364  [mRNA]  locus=scaffold3980:93982:112606:+ [translate_table: standard]
MADGLLHQAPVETDVTQYDPRASGHEGASGAADHLQKWVDGELPLAPLLDTSVTLLNKHEHELQVQAEDKAAEMASKVAAATMEQIKVQLESDAAKLRKQLPSKLDETLECAKDVKHAEFCRACVKRIIEGQTQPHVVYYGVMREEHKRVVPEIEAEVFQYWDNLTTSPAKNRPRPAAAEVRVEGLALCSHTATGAVWPEQLLEKFPRDTPHYKELLELKAKILAELATLVGKQGKPSVIVSKGYELYIGNETDAAATYPACEMFGFGTGSFEFKLVHGGVCDPSGPAWRFHADIEYVCVDKKLVPICEFMHQCAVQHGLADVGIQEHNIQPKLHPAVP